MAKKEEYYIDPETGKKYRLSDFDETRSWSKDKKKVQPAPKPKSNILGRV